jgi:pimeloyl-ACP methyl ester carboxylesterase
MKKLFLFSWFIILLTNSYAQENIILHTHVKGIPIAYTKTGNGPAIVLLHGFAQDSRIWKRQIESLSENFTVVTWDVPGAGQSADPKGHFTIEDWAVCLADLMDAVGIKKAHILGLSWGGLLAQEFYHLYPDRVLSLILTDTTVGWAGTFSDSIADARLAICIHDSSLPVKDFVSKYLPGMFSDSVPAIIKDELAGIMSDTHPIGFQLMATAVAKADTRALLPDILVPTLLLWGDSDKRAPLSVAYQMRDAIPGAKLVIMTGAGHVSNMEKPDQFNKAVNDFCLSIPAKN